MSSDRLIQEVWALPASQRPTRTRPAAAGTGQDLYAVFCLETRRCKIGRANKIWHRLEALQIGSPTALMVYAFAPGLGCRERTMHEFFADHRLHGEWFTPHVTAAIASAVRPENTQEFARFVETLHRNRINESVRRAREPKPDTFEWRGRKRPL